MALQTEFFKDYQETIRTILEGFQVRLWTALPGIITQVNFGATSPAVTVSVQPAIQAIQRDEQGNLTYVTLPVLLDVPVVFPRGGGNGANGFTLTFPVAVGDECLVILSCRAIDNWWAQGGVQQPAEIRYHDLSDGFAIIGPFSQPNVPTAGIDPANVMLMKNDGSTYIQITPAGAMTLLAPRGVIIQGNLTVTGETLLEENLEVSGATQLDAGVTVTGTAQGPTGTLNINGNITATGEVTANGGHTVSAHTHANVTNGPDVTDPPTG